METVMVTADELTLILEALNIAGALDVYDDKYDKLYDELENRKHLNAN